MKIQNNGQDTALVLPHTGRSAVVKRGEIITVGKEDGEALVALVPFAEVKSKTPKTNTEAIEASSSPKEL